MTFLNLTTIAMALFISSPDQALYPEHNNPVEHKLIIDSPNVNTQESGNLEITFSGIKENTGTVHVALYKGADAFMKKAIKRGKAKVNGNEVTIIFEGLSYGEYTVSAYHDENENDKMDTKTFGIPVEPYGFSNNARGMFGPPSYEDCMFKVNKDLVKQLIKLK